MQREAFRLRTETSVISVVSFALTGILLTFLAACSGSSVAPSVSVAAAATNVDGGDATTVTATVAHDKNAAGVTWTVSGGGTLSNITTTTATYTAPAPTSSSQTATITATSVADTTKTGTVAITIPAAPSVTSTSASLAGAVGSPYSVTLAASGGIAPYTWSLAGGSTLPNCLTLKSTGVITTASGLPPTASCAGTYSNLTFTATDSGTPTALSATSSALSITIAAPTLVFPTSLPGATVGSAYSQSVAAAGALGTATYSIASGSLPGSGDLTLNTSTGAISGTPKYADVGTYTFTIGVTDQYGDTATSGSLSIKIAAPGTITLPATIQGATGSTATAGQLYTGNVTASGGAGVLSYTITAGSLPTTLALNSTTGIIAGTPTAATSYIFTVKASDSYGDPPASQQYTLTVNPGAGTHFVLAANTSTTVTAGGTLGFNITAEDSDGNTATGYAGTVKFTSTDNQAAFSPNNITLTNGTGSSTATLKTAGSQSITATDAVTSSINGSLSGITVNAGSATKLAVVAPSTATIGTAFGFSVYAQDQYGNTATGNTDTVHIASSDSAASLPANASLVNGVQTFSATLNTNGSQTITATDTTNAAITAGTSGPIAVSTDSIALPAGGALASATEGQAYQTTITATGGVSPYTWSINGTTVGGSGLSVGNNLTATASGGILTIAGTPNSTTGVTLTNVKVTDSLSVSSTPQTYTIAVNAAALVSCTSNGSQNSILHGNYAFLLSGFDPNGNPYDEIGDFQANGSGTISNGNADVNTSAFSTTEQNFTFAGTYSAGDSSSDDRGVTNWTNTNTSATGLPSSTTYCFTADTVTNGIAYSGRIIEADGSGFVLTGFFEIQDSANFTAASLNSGYAFGVQGWGGQQQNGGWNRTASIGQIALNGSGSVTSGQEDNAEYSFTGGSTTYTPQISVTGGSYTMTASGRGTLTINTGSGSMSFVTYTLGSASANKLLMLGAGVGNNGGLFVGQAIQQTTTSFTTASLNGPSAFWSNGLDENNPPVDDVEVGQISFNGSGGASALIDENDGGTVIGPTAISSATYSVSSLGYVQLAAAGNHPPNLYLYAPGSGFGLNGSSSVDFFYLTAQTVPSGGFTNANLTGSFAFGTIDPTGYDITGADQYPGIEDGAVTFSSGTVTGTNDNVTAPGLAAQVQVNGAINSTDALDATYGATAGRFVISQSGTQELVGYFVSPTQVFLIQDQSGQDGLVIEANGQQ